MKAEASFAPNFVALRPALLRRTAGYACVKRASERLVIHQNSPRPKRAVRMGNTNLDSSGDRGGSEEPHPQAGTRTYLGYVEESDIATTKVYA